MKKNELLPVEEEQRMAQDYNKIVEQGQQIMKIMDAIGLVEGKFKNGVHVTSTSTSKTISNRDVIMIKKEHTTAVIFRNEGSSTEEALNELDGTFTQEILGGFAQKSQAWISEKLNNKDDENE